MSDVTAETEYRVLARKYRPQNFDDLIGQEPMVRTLSNAFAANRIAQAYMLTGVRGVGKTTTARILARALNYETDTVKTPSLDLSELGIHCPAIMEGNHVDVIEMDAASHTGIGDIREIIASVRYKPVSARYKVYIIDEVHMLSNQAFNGLLKTLEEPPEHVKFIFATTEIRKVPITVLSRCQRFDLRRIGAGELTEHLAKIVDAEGAQAERDALVMISRAGEGSARDALSLLDQAIAHAGGSGSESGGKVLAEDVRNMLGLADRARVIDLFEHLMKGNIAAALGDLKEQFDVGADPATVLNDLAEFVHFVTRVRYVDTALDDPTLSEEEKTRGKDFAEKLSPRILGRTWQMLLKGIAEVQVSSRPLAAADMVLVRIAHAADLPTPDEVIKTLTDNPTTRTASTSRTVLTSNGPETSASPPQPAVSETAMPVRPQPGTQMKQVANGPSLIVDNGQPMERAVSEPVAETQLNEPALRSVYDSIETFDDLLNVAEKKRDIRFKMILRNNFSEVSFEPGHITFCPVGNAPPNTVQMLRDRLKQWTGEHWQITVSEDAGRATIKEVEVATHEKNVADAEADPVVAAVLKTFPKSKIVAVRFPEHESTDGLDEAAAADAALENPDDEMQENASDPGAGSMDDYF
ncbi:MAG: DNA polymerase III subunit gamma/tau [Pseudomonadota bacterium]